MTRQTKTLSAGPTGATGSTGQPGMTEIAIGQNGVLATGIVSGRYYAPITGTSVTINVNMAVAGTSDTVVTVTKNGAAIGTVTLASGVLQGTPLVVGTAFTQDVDYFGLAVSTLGSGSPATLTTQMRFTGAVAGAALTSIATLTDVNLTGLTDGDLLAWNAAQGKFVRATYNASTTPAIGRDAVPASPNAADYEFEAVTSSPPSGWSWVNQGSATYQEQYGAGLLTGTQQSGDNWRMITRAIPSASSWTATVKAGVPVVSANYTDFAPLVLRNSSNGKFYALCIDPSRNAVVRYWNSLTSYNSTPGSQGIGSIPFYWRIRKNTSTSWDFHYSMDGISWKTCLGANDITTNLGGAPDQIGLGCNSNGFTDNSVAIHWFRLT